MNVMPNIIKNLLVIFCLAFNTIGLAEDELPPRMVDFGGFEVNTNDPIALKKLLTEALSKIIESELVGKPAADSAIIDKLAIYVGWDKSLLTLPVRILISDEGIVFWDAILKKGRPEYSEIDEKLKKLTVLAEVGIADMADFYQTKQFSRTNIPGFIGILLAVSEIERLRSKIRQLDVSDFVMRLQTILKQPEYQRFYREYVELSDSDLWREIMDGCKPPEEKKTVWESQPAAPPPSVAETKSESESITEPEPPEPGPVPLALNPETDPFLPPPLWSRRTNLVSDKNRIEKLNELLSLILEFDEALFHQHGSQALSDIAWSKFTLAHRSSGFRFPRIRIRETTDGTKNRVLYPEPPLAENYPFVIETLRNWEKQRRGEKNLSPLGAKFIGFRGPIGAEYALFAGVFNEGAYRGEVLIYFDPIFPTEQRLSANADGTVGNEAIDFRFESNFQLLFVGQDNPKIWRRKVWGAQVGMETSCEIQLDEKRSTSRRPTFKIRLPGESGFIPLAKGFANAYNLGGSSGRLSLELTSMDESATAFAHAALKVKTGAELKKQSEQIAKAASPKEKFELELIFDKTKRIYDFLLGKADNLRERPVLQLAPYLTKGAIPHTAELMQYRGLISQSPLAWETGQNGLSALAFSVDGTLLSADRNGKALKWTIGGSSGITSEPYENAFPKLLPSWEGLLSKAFEEERQRQLQKIQAQEVKLSPSAIDQIETKVRQQNTLDADEWLFLHSILEQKRASIAAAPSNVLKLKSEDTQLRAQALGSSLAFTLSRENQLVVWRKSVSKDSLQIISSGKLPGKPTSAIALSSDQNFLAIGYDGGLIELYLVSTLVRDLDKRLLRPVASVNPAELVNLSQPYLSPSPSLTLDLSNPFGQRLFEVESALKANSNKLERARLRLLPAFDEMEKKEKELKAVLANESGGRSIEITNQLDALVTQGNVMGVEITNFRVLEALLQTEKTRILREQKRNAMLNQKAPLLSVEMKRQWDDIEIRIKNLIEEDKKLDARIRPKIEENYQKAKVMEAIIFQSPDSSIRIPDVIKMNGFLTNIAELHKEYLPLYAREDQIWNERAALLPMGYSEAPKDPRPAEVPTAAEVAYTSPISGRVINRTKIDRFAGQDSKTIEDTLITEGVVIIYLDPDLKSRRYDRRNKLTEEEVLRFYEFVERERQALEGGRATAEAEQEKLFGKSKEPTQQALQAIQKANHDGAYYIAPHFSSLNEQKQLVSLPYTTSPRIILLATEGQSPPASVITHEYAHYLFAQAGQNNKVDLTEKDWAQEVQRLQTLISNAKTADDLLKANLEIRASRLKSGLWSVLVEGEVYVFQIENYDNQKMSDEFAYSLFLGIKQHIADYTTQLKNLALTNSDPVELKRIMTIAPIESKKLVAATRKGVAETLNIAETLGAEGSKAAELNRKFGSK